MSKLTGLHTIFRKIPIFGSNKGFRHVRREMFKTEGDRSSDYTEKLDQQIVHGWGVQVCCPAFPVLEPVQVPDLGWQRQNTSCQNQQSCISMLCTLTSDMSPIEHLKDIFGQRVRHKILAQRNLYALNVPLQEESRLIPRYQITRIIQSIRNQCKY